MTLNGHLRLAKMLNITSTLKVLNRSGYRHLSQVTWQMNTVW